MTEDFKLGFEMDGITLPMECILPTRQVSEAQRKSTRYIKIRASIEQVGIVEPPMVHPVENGKGASENYLLLDGHVRIDILKGLGHTEVYCLVSKDDESYTFNQKVNGLAPIQEHYMIMRVIEQGVSEEEIAEALNVDVAAIRQKRNMIKDICPEAVELLRDKQITPAALAQLKKVRPMRQIEMAELMIGANNYSKAYVEALIAATPRDSFVNPDQGKEKLGIKPEDMARMEREMESLEKDFKAIEDTYAQNVLHLVLARGYLVKLLDNPKVVRFLTGHCEDILAQFQSLAEASSLEQ